MAGVIDWKTFESEGQRCIDAKWHTNKTVTQRRTGYLEYELIKPNAQPAHEDSTYLATEPEESCLSYDALSTIEDEDHAAADDTRSGSHPQAWLKYRYHVLYSSVYSVPELYFEVSKPTGQVLSYSDVMATLAIGVPELAASITYKAHPVFSGLWCHLHPCNTATLLSELRQQIGASTPEQEVPYLTTWSSAVGTLVGLPILQCQPL
eukprot:m.19020 g.19020  ORF g.19020 m.19020 type:complete len:207 (+) comp10882_c0_seq1:24-644(+)